uniref:CSON011549 protein n=1 Tax=Culicoides sonorensis TaxID=179676 RepID=A0A336M7I0_CULSO
MQYNNLFLSLKLIVVALAVMVLAGKFDYFPECRAYLKEVKENNAEFKPLYWPHETDCSKFYECGAEGTVYELDCPKNLVFSALNSTCGFWGDPECKSQQKNFLATLLGFI